MSEIVKLEVDFMSIKEHISQKTGKTLINVLFKLNDEFRPFVSLYLCFEGDGYSAFPVEKAKENWKIITGSDNCPLNTAQALERKSELKKITHVTVDYSGDFPEIKDYEFQEQTQEEGGDCQQNSDQAVPEEDLPF